MPEPTRPDPRAVDVAEWLRHARSDLTLATSEPPGGVLLEHLLYHAQQAAEKAIKAVLLARGADVPRTHDIGLLLDRAAAGGALPDEIAQAGSLTMYAVLTRYPADLGEPTDDEAAEARALATAVVEWAEAAIAARVLDGEARRMG